MANGTWGLPEDPGSVRIVRLAVAAALALAAFLVLPGRAGAAVALIPATSPDAGHVFIQSFDPLLPADTDMEVDVYERTGGVTSLVSTGPSGGNGTSGSDFSGASADGSHVYFRTFESLVPGDTDTYRDIYQHAGGVTSLLSAGQINGNGAFEATFEGASADGSRAFFSTSEKLVSSDTDTEEDVYERSAGVTTKVSNGTANSPATFVGATPDGGHVFFTTAESLSGSDTDTAIDLYDRSASGTALVSAGQTNGNGAFNVNYSGASTDGSRVFFETNEKLVAADTDASQDLYERSGGVTSLVSAGQINGNGAFDATFSGASADGGLVVFETDEKLVTADTDSSTDLYQRSGGVTSLVSAGQINGNGAFPTTFDSVSTDGSRVSFRTSEPLVAADTDSSQDIYERSAGTTTLVSAGQINGNGAFPASNGGASADGTRLLFSSGEQLVPGDTDSSTDVYERSGGVTSLVSTGLVNGNGAFPAAQSRVSADGAHAFFVTGEPLVPGDTDLDLDAYERVNGQTRLVTTGKPAPAAPGLTLTPKGPANHNSVSVKGSAEALSSVALYATADCTGTPLSVLSAESLGAGVADKVANNTKMSFTATATDANNWTSACSKAVRYTEDSKAPKAKIKKHPKKLVKTHKARAKVTFKLHSEAGAKLRCKLDHKKALKCGKVKSYKVRPGRHTFRLTATDAAGNTSKPTVFKFKVVRRH